MMNIKSRNYVLACAAIVLGMSAATTVLAEVKVSQVPMAKAASQRVPPNLLFILDDSGSMGSDYTPDYVSNSRCRSSNSTTSLTSCSLGHVPYMSSAYNRQYYDPNVRYTPGTKADGSSYPEMTSGATAGWTQVLVNGYVGSTKKNLLSTYTDLNLCNSADSTDCKRNSSYAYPNAIYTSLSTVNDVAPYYFNLKPLYCTNEDATNCSKTYGGAYVVTVPYRWCKSGTFSDCKARRDSTYSYPSFIEPETGIPAQLRLTFSSCVRNTTQTVTSVKVDGVEILSGTASYAAGNSTSCNNIANAVVGKISSSAQFTATRNNNVVTLTAKTSGTWANYTPSITSTKTTGAGSVYVQGTDGFVFFNRVNITSAQDKYQIAGGKPTERTDCTTYADGCSYSEEMTNFANWYAYYRTRMQMMKSAVSRAFKDIDSTFRVGFTQINSLSGAYVTVKAFDSAQRTSWYSKLLGANPNGYTPLREALSFAGRVYAGDTPGTITDDPVQYSCQQNFALLTTDGYWNGPGGDTSGTGVLNADGSAKISNEDGSGTPRPYYEGPTASSTSLSDVAAYYYNTDIRSSALGNCTSALTGADVCENNVPISASDTNSSQHMVTYTLGLGVDGLLKYRSDYKTALSGDYYDIKNGARDWPVPQANNDSAVDDLWHAAVNGRGQYFSAQNPTVLVASLKDALASIAAQYGAGAAAATSTAEPVNGDNFAYVATYTTGEWTGNLESRKIDLSTGVVGLQAEWCAESIDADPVRNITACTGTMQTKVSATADTRKIYFNSGGGFANFTLSQLSSYLSKFDVTKLNQYSTWSTDYKAAANSENLINYLRGQKGFETVATNDFQLYRGRTKVLGDFIGSAPKYVCKASGNYTDPGYESFASSLGGSGNCTRTPMIYIGGNDGMLHAFNGTTGEEVWAFVPTPVLTEMWRLADTTYSNNHRFYVDGSPVVADVCVSGCGGSSAVWKTILVAGLGAGVVQGSDPDTGNPKSGYFAIDITDPAAPKLLWEITSDTAGIGNRIGFAFGKPVPAKIPDGASTRWAVLFSSGFKPANGAAAIIAVDAYSGDPIRTFDISGAQGVTRFSAQYVKSGYDLTASRVYAGDLDGNVWRVDLATGAIVKALAGAGQPFTTAPTLTVCNGKTVVYIGSGKFVEASDATDKAQQSFYGFVDDYDAVGTLASPRTALQKLSVSGSTIAPSSSSGSNKGWYIDLPDIPSAGGAERVALVDPKLEGSILTFATNIPESGVCLASGRSKIYQQPLRTCSITDTFPAMLTGEVRSLGNTLVVGITSIKLPDGTIKIITTGSDGTLGTIQSGQSAGSPPFSGRRMNWRELLRN